MADSGPAFEFTMRWEDPDLKGDVHPDPTDTDPNAVERWGLNSHWFPNLVAQGYFTSMSKEDSFRIAQHVYEANYFGRILGWQIQDQSIATKIADLAYNEGCEEATKITQRAVNSLQTGLTIALAVDGQFGKGTLTAVNLAQPADLLAAIKGYAEDFYRSWAIRENKPDSELQSLLRRVSA